MKPNRIIALALILLFAIVSFAADKTFTGTLTDNMCAKEKQHMIPGKSDADCVRECAHHGGWFVLATPDHQIYKLKADAKQLDPLAGKQVKVTGQLSGDTIAVSSIAAK